MSDADAIKREMLQHIENAKHGIHYIYRGQGRHIPNAIRRFYNEPDGFRVLLRKCSVSRGKCPINGTQRWTNTLDLLVKMNGTWYRQREDNVDDGVIRWDVDYPVSTIFDEPYNEFATNY